jgi:hypothetical protein
LGWVDQVISHEEVTTWGLAYYYWYSWLVSDYSSPASLRDYDFTLDIIIRCRGRFIGTDNHTRMVLPVCALLGFAGLLFWRALYVAIVALVVAGDCKRRPNLLGMVASCARSSLSTV